MFRLGKIALLALVLGAGPAAADEDLAKITCRQLNGYTAEKIASLLATTELPRRFALAQVPDREPLLHPSAVARYLLLAFGVSDQEVMGGLYLDVRNRLPHAFSAVALRVAVAQLDGLALARGRARRHDRAADAAVVEHHPSLDGRIAARVEHLEGRHRHDFHARPR